MISPGVMSKEASEKLNEIARVSARADLMGRTIGREFNIWDDEARANLEKTLEKSKDEWWDREAKKWIGL